MLTIELSIREKQCLYWAGQDKNLIETAEKLNLSPESIKRYRKQALHKLECKTISGAIFAAVQLGILKN